MGRDTHLVALGHVAALIGEPVEFLEEIAANSDNIDYGELIYVSIGPDEGLNALTGRGIESIKELLADIRSSPGGVREFLTGQGTDPKTIERICKKPKG